MRTLILLLGMLASAPCLADSYEISVTRKESNFYRVDGRDLYIQTRYCYEYAYSEEALLRMQGNTGSLHFLGNGARCDVKAVFASSQITPGRYEVTISREDDDWYEVFGTETYVRTSYCLSLALGEAALLEIRAGSFGRLVLLDRSGEECQVEGVYSKVRL